MNINNPTANLRTITTPIIYPIYEPRSGKFRGYGHIFSDGNIRYMMIDKPFTIWELTELKCPNSTLMKEIPIELVGIIGAPTPTSIRNDIFPGTYKEILSRKEYVSTYDYIDASDKSLGVFRTKTESMEYRAIKYVASSPYDAILQLGFIEDTNYTESGYETDFKSETSIRISNGYIIEIETSEIIPEKILIYRFEGSTPNGLFKIKNGDYEEMFNVDHGYLKGRYFLDNVTGTFRDNTKFTGFTMLFDYKLDDTVFSNGKDTSFPATQSGGNPCYVFHYDDKVLIALSKGEVRIHDGSDDALEEDSIVPQDYPDVNDGLPEETYIAPNDANFSTYFVVDGKFEGPGINSTNDYRTEDEEEDYYDKESYDKVLVWYVNGRKIEYQTYSNIMYRYINDVNDMLDIVTSGNQIKLINDIIMGYFEPYDTFKIYLNRLYNNYEFVKGSDQIQSLINLLK